jgi:hypothetical protein
MGHWANSREFKEARRRRDAATVLALRSRLTVALLIEGESVPKSRVWDAITRVHETRGIYRLLVSPGATRWRDLGDWSGWWHVRHVPADIASLPFVRPGGVVAFDCPARTLEGLRSAGIPVWEPALPRAH